MKKNDQIKKLIIEQLHKSPIIEAACQRVGVSRMTFYRWKEEDEKFAESIEEALLEGRLLVNDLAETQLISAVKDRNLAAITYWLKHHHPKYATKVEVTAKLQSINQQLTPEQQEVVDKALRLAALTDESGEGKEISDGNNAT